MTNARSILNYHVLHDCETICIYYDFVDDWLYADWIGEQSLETVKYGCEQILLYLKAERTHKLLNDNTNVTNNWSEASDWIATDFLPRIAVSGLEYIAWVYSPNHFSRLSADEVIELYKAVNIVAIGFMEIEEAKDWLRSV